MSTVLKGPIPDLCQTGDERETGGPVVYIGTMDHFQARFHQFGMARIVGVLREYGSRWLGIMSTFRVRKNIDLELSDSKFLKLFLQRPVGIIDIFGPPLFVFVQQTYKPDRKSTRLNSSHVAISYAVFCLKKKNAVL